MIKATKYFLLILLFVIPISWLSNYPGEVRILWNGYFIETTVVAILLIVVILVIIILSMYIFFSKISDIPNKYRNYKKEKNFLLGNKALTNLTKSIVDGNRNELEINARKIKKYFNNSIFSAYFIAQNSISDSDFIKARKYLNLLLKTSEGKFIALKGLSIVSMREKKNDEALNYLKQAKKIQPNNLWVSDNLSLLLAKKEKWEEAAFVLSEIKNDLRLQNNRASFLIQSGKSPIEALKISSEIIPVAVKAIEHYLNLDNEKYAYSILKKTWRNLQYVKMIDVFMDTNNNSEKGYLRRFKLVLKALKPSLEYDETKLAMAIASFKVSLWAETKKYLELINEDKWDKRIINLWKLLSIETKKLKIPDFPKQIINEPSWKCTACGNQTEEWSISCKNCGDIGKIIWPKSIKQFKKQNLIEINL